MLTPGPLNNHPAVKIVFYALSLLFLMSCANEQQQNEKRTIQYTDLQLENYLDSIGGLSTSLLTDKASFLEDSIFKNQLQTDRLLSDSDFSKLKEAMRKDDEIDGVMDIETAQKIFGKIEIDTAVWSENQFLSSYLKRREIPITLLSFDKNETDLNEYAICLGYPDARWDCKLYFFKRNKIIAEHFIYHRYGLDLNHYKDSDGKTVIYYTENFEEGEEMWQFNLYFYKYYDGKLIPILNELESGNSQMFWGHRIRWFEASVTSTSPLTLKMVYYQGLYDTISGRDDGRRIIDDSTFVQYFWNEKSKTLMGDYEKAKISQPQILTYSPGSDELLFINVYHETLKACLQDKTKRQPTLNYLNEVKNLYENN